MEYCNNYEVNRENTKVELAIVCRIVESSHVKLE